MSNTVRSISAGSRVPRIGVLRNLAHPHPFAGAADHDGQAPNGRWIEFRDARLDAAEATLERVEPALQGW